MFGKGCAEGIRRLMQTYGTVELKFRLYEPDEKSDKWRVFTGSGRKIGSYATRDEALDAARAIASPESEGE